MGFTSRTFHPFPPIILSGYKMGPIVFFIHFWGEGVDAVCSVLKVTEFPNFILVELDAFSEKTTIACSLVCTRSLV